jgi:hypothetical protein
VTRTPKDLGLSAQARLRNLAQQRGDDVQVLLTQFVLERLLHRLVASTHASDFVLKGAMLFAAWTSVPHRATRDLDLLGSGAPDPERLAQVFRVVCATAVEPDGVSFDTASVRAARIREDQVYEGIRVTLDATLATARIGVQVDIGFGDTVHPGPVELAYPSLLGLPTPRLLTYPRETVVAEKFQAMVSLGELNSRMKDFFDLFTLAAQFEFAGPVLAEAIRRTFARRSTELPATPPIALRPAFAELRDKQAQWQAFVRRTRLLDTSITLDVIVPRLHTFLWPILLGLRGDRAMPLAWPVGGPWS